MSTCRKCRTAIPEDAAVCPSCGQPPPAPTWRTGALYVVVVVLVVPFVILMAAGGSVAEEAWVRGAVELSGGPQGTIRFAPTACRPGSDWAGGAFTGVALPDGSPPTTVVRVVRERDDATTVVLGTRAASGEPWQVVTLTPATCPALKVELERRKPWHGGRVTRRYYGSATVDCQLPDGTRALGAVRFGDCR